MGYESCTASFVSDLQFPVYGAVRLPQFRGGEIHSTIHFFLLTVEPRFQHLDPGVVGINILNKVFKTLDISLEVLAVKFIKVPANKEHLFNVADILVSELTSRAESNLLVLSEHTVDFFVALGNQFEILSKLPLTLHGLLLAGKLNSSHSLVIEHLTHLQNQVIQCKFAVQFVGKLNSWQLIELADVMVR